MGRHISGHKSKYVAAFSTTFNDCRPNRFSYRATVEFWRSPFAAQPRMFDVRHVRDSLLADGSANTAVRSRPGCQFHSSEYSFAGLRRPSISRIAQVQVAVTAFVRRPNEPSSSTPFNRPAPIDSSLSIPPNRYVESDCGHCLLCCWGSVVHVSGLSVNPASLHFIGRAFLQSVSLAVPS
jgi:hypothetical protein